MEEELRCPACKKLYNNPVLLPCYHALCLNCAVHLQQPASQNPPSNCALNPVLECAGGCETSGGSELSVIDYQEVDKLSILSETDSGVVCNSRPNSYVGTPHIQGLLFPPVVSSALSLACPICQKIVYFDETGALNLPKYRAMQRIVDKYNESRNFVLKCQLCEAEPAADAVVLCEQCEILYCEECRENCHPPRGPLAKHNLLPPLVGRAMLLTKSQDRDTQCSEHEDEILSLYCMVCKVSLCPSCLQDTRHTSHDVQAVNTMCKAQKTELSQNLQQLSEKARSTTECIQRLKGLTEKVNENCAEFEELVSAQCDALVTALQERKKQLLDIVQQNKEMKLRALKDQVSTCTSKLQHTTSLLQFCIEALKENDSAAFLQFNVNIEDIVNEVLDESDYHSRESTFSDINEPLLHERTTEQKFIEIDNSNSDDCEEEGSDSKICIPLPGPSKCLDHPKKLFLQNNDISEDSSMSNNSGFNNGKSQTTFSRYFVSWKMRQHLFW